jgi:peptidyl-prolyl cis-trans isomerase A (cyclophilin A)
MMSWLTLSWLVACGPDPELVAERDRLKTEAAAAEKMSARLEKENDALHGRMRKLETRISSLEEEKAFIQLGIEPKDRLHAQLQTSMGTIQCELWPQQAPTTVLNFVQLAEGTREWTHPATNEKQIGPLYNGTIFHRVMPEFMIQGGDPIGNGQGGPGYKFEDEVSSGLKFDDPGILAMANSGPNTNGSQFFITDRSTPHHLDGKHTIFGKCDNLDVVEAIATAPTTLRNKPDEDVVLKRVIIQRIPSKG